MKTTLNEIRKYEPYQDFWETLLRHLNKTEPDDEPLPLLTVLESNGLEDTLWCFRAVEGFDREKRLLAIAFARQVEHLMPDASKSALDVAERFANGLATEEELSQAYAAAYAAWAAWAAADDAARAAAYAAWAARAAADDDAARAADDAARAAAWAAWAATAARAADDAARAAAWAADADAAARSAANSAPYKAARSEMQDKQTEILKQFLEETT